MILLVALWAAAPATADDARLVEAERLRSEVIAHRRAGEYQQAIPKARRALALREAALGGAHPELAVDLNNLGHLLQTTGRYAEAEPLQRRALAISEKALGPEHPTVAARLNNLAYVLQATGRYGEAEPMCRRALEISEKALGPGHPTVATRLNNLAGVLEATGRYGDAEPLYRRALAISEKALGPEHPTVATLLNNLAYLMETTGRYAEAEPLYRRALALSEKALGPEHPDVAVRLNNLAALLATTGRHAEAEPLYRRSLAIDEAALGPEHPDVAERLNNLAVLLRNTDRHAEAEALYRRSLALYQAALGPEHPDVATSLNNLAYLLEATGRGGEAEPLYRRAYRIATTAGEPELLWRMQSRLRSFYTGTRPAQAIFYGKQAVNTLQALRANLATAEKATQAAFAESVGEVYRELSDLLIDQGRLAEAEQVLGLLKQQELFDYLRRDAAAEARLDAPSYTRKEARLAERYDAISTRVFALARERTELLRIHETVRTPAQKKRIAELDARLDRAREQVLAFLDEVAKTFREEGGQKAVEFGRKDLEALEGVQQTLAELGEQGHPAVLVHYLVTPERLRILVTTAEAQLHRDSAIAEADLNRMVLAYRQTLQDPHKDPRPQARALYDTLVAPIAADLEQAGGRTLMLSLDGVLRYLPVAALHDGERWLVERYSLALYTAAARANLAAAPAAQWRVAGLGVSQGGTIANSRFEALPSVPAELAAIVRDNDAQATGVLPGIRRLDGDFTREALVEAIQGFPVVHLASHFNFRPTEDGSYLLLGNSQALSLADFRKGSSYRLTKVDLLTLSACETAMGAPGADGREVEGLGALAQNRGARSVLATLWPVADATTASFMQGFYQNREAQRLPKAEALRQAQLGFIHGRVTRASVDTLRGASRPGRDNPAVRAWHASPEAPYSHPFFWAPFILMGNWR